MEYQKKPPRPSTIKSMNKIPLMLFQGSSSVFLSFATSIKPPTRKIMKRIASTKTTPKPMIIFIISTLNLYNHLQSNVMVHTFFHKRMVLGHQLNFGKFAQCNIDECRCKHHCQANFKETNSTFVLHNTRSNHVVEVKPVANDYDGTHHIQH